MTYSDDSQKIAWYARWKLFAIVLFTTVCLGVSAFSTKPELSEVRSSRPGDIALYQAEINRIRAGQDYYPAALQELTTRGYPTRSVFNWRTPLPMWLIGILPTGWGKMLLMSLALLLLLMAFAAVARDGEILNSLPSPTGRGAGGEGSMTDPVQPGPYHRLTLPALTVLLLTGPLLFIALDRLYVMPVLWAGVFIALSLCAYGIDRPAWGVFFGILAVFFRELALPYAMVAVAIAAWNRRRRELLFWFLGLTAWTAFYGLHAWNVTAIIPPNSHAHAHGWLQCGGLEFLFDMVQINAYLINLPHWAGALYFVAALVGFASWNTPLGRRMTFTACIFLLAFAFVGQEFNRYWGALIAPLMCFGVAQSVFAIKDLWNSAWSRLECDVWDARINNC
jgi:hypothetical protein